MSYPAFATHEDALVSYTKANIAKRLKGRYGFKRFKRDGYKCAIEDETRMYYNVGETKVSIVSSEDGEGIPKTDSNPAHIPDGPGDCFSF